MGGDDDKDAASLVDGIDGRRCDGVDVDAAEDVSCGGGVGDISGRRRRGQ